MGINKDNRLSAAGELRLRAEGRLKAQVKGEPPRADHDTQRLLHELQVHQIELEMQNAELSRSQEELETRVRERTAELERINSELEEFCYAISHEFRAPIARVEGFVGMMIDILGEDGEEQVVHCAERIMAATIRLKAVIDSLLTLNRLSRSEMLIQNLDLSEMAMRIVSELVENIGQRSLHILIAPNLKATADKHMTEICLRNLLENAIKYSSNNPDAAVEFGQKEIQGKNVYFIKDNGVGFDMKFAQKIFQPFCRLHKKEEFDGTGVGLATVHRIVEKHDGKIWVKAKPGKGATFYFTLETGQGKNALSLRRNANRLSQ